MPNKRDFNHFEYNPVDIDIRRSIFNLDHSVKWSANIGEVIPFDIIECNPGETFEIDTSKVIRLQPMVAPMMDEILCDVAYFYVPHRLVWNHWVNFCGENTESAWAPETTYSVPKISSPSGGWEVGTIADYLGVPPKVDTYASALPFRSYALICDQWYRSESVMNPVHCYVDDYRRTGSNGNDQVTDIELGGKPFIACKLADYFTTALPAPQRGAASNVFPVDAVAPVIPYDSDTQAFLGVTHPYSYNKSGTYTSTTVAGFDSANNRWSLPELSNVLDTNYLLSYGYTGDDSIGASLTNYPPDVGGLDSENNQKLAFNNLFAQLPASTFNINDLRQAFAVQRYLEKSARYGGRYIEFIKGFFGTDSPDARLQRTEFLGGSRFVLNVNQVTQNSATQSGSTPLGNVAGMSVSADQHHDVSYSTTEHGYIIGCCVLRHHPSYQQGLNRLFLRQNFTDFYLPTFAHLGEQAVYQQELFANNDPVAENPVFGYQERYAEYRYLPNRIAGEMRSVYSQSLDMWHLADYYESAPRLSPEWIREDKSVLDRVLAVTSDVSNQAICDFFIECKASRPMPLYGVPGMIDHY